MKYFRGTLDFHSKQKNSYSHKIFRQRAKAALATKKKDDIIQFLVREYEINVNTESITVKDLFDRTNDQVQ